MFDLSPSRELSLAQFGLVDSMGVIHPREPLAAPSGKCHKIHSNLPRGASFSHTGYIGADPAPQPRWFVARSHQEGSRNDRSRGIPEA